MSNESNSKLTRTICGNFWHDANNKLHRDGGPAIEYVGRMKIWYQHGDHHREDGPAIEDANGDKYWYQHGQRHREEGPAVERANGTKEWWIEGKQLNTSSQEEFERYIKLKAFW